MKRKYFYKQIKVYPDVHELVMQDKRGLESASDVLKRWNKERKKKVK